MPVVADGYKGCLRDAEILQAVGTATLQLAEFGIDRSIVRYYSYLAP